LHGEVAVQVGANIVLTLIYSTFPATIAITDKFGGAPLLPLLIRMNECLLIAVARSRAAVPVSAKLRPATPPNLAAMWNG
jgi:hypothetical protein